MKYPEKAREEKLIVLLDTFIGKLKRLLQRIWVKEFTHPLRYRASRVRWSFLSALQAYLEPLNGLLK